MDHSESLAPSIVVFGEHVPVPVDHVLADGISIDPNVNIVIWPKFTDSSVGFPLTTSNVSSILGKVDPTPTFNSTSCLRKSYEIL